MPRRLSSLLIALATLGAVACLVLGARPAAASPEAHILRIDPRAGLQNGKPVLTTVIEVIQFKRLSDVLQPCANVAGAGTLLRAWSEPTREARRPVGPLPVPRAERAPARQGGRRRPAHALHRQDAVGQGPEPGERRHGVARLGRRRERYGVALRRHPHDRARVHRADAAKRSHGPHVLRRRSGREGHQVEDVQAAGRPGQRPQRLQVADLVARPRSRALQRDQEHDAGRVRVPRKFRPARRGAAAPGDGAPLERRRARRPGEREPQRRRLPSVPPRSGRFSWPTTRRSRRRRCRSSPSGSRTPRA